jgi:hypothetical protein
MAKSASLSDYCHSHAGWCRSSLDTVAPLIANIGERSTRRKTLR